MAKIEFGKGFKDKLQGAVDSAKTVAKEVKIPEVKVKAPDVKATVANIKDAMKKKDEALAEQLMREHIRQNYAYFEQ